MHAFSGLPTLAQLRKHILELFQQDYSSQTTQKLKLGLPSFQCIGLQEVDKIVIQCLDKHNNSRKAIIMPRRNAKQLLAVSDNSDDTPILLRTSKAVELWKYSNGNYTLVGSLLDGQQLEHITIIRRRAGMESGFLAVLASSPATEIRIYRILGDDFQLDQILELQDSHQAREVRFLHLPESEDLLLGVSNVVPHQSLTIYQHRGAAGFQKILGDSALPEVQSLDVLQLPVNKLQLLSVATAESVYLVQPQFTTL